MERESRELQGGKAKKGLQAQEGLEKHLRRDRVTKYRRSLCPSKDLYIGGLKSQSKQLQGGGDSRREL